MNITREQQKISYRPMRLEDIERVQEIDSLSFSLPWPKSSFEFELKNPASRPRVAEIMDENDQPVLVGMICAWIILDELHIATIATHPDFRKQGIGKKMLAKMLLEAASEGVKLAYLEVRRGNLVAQKLYAEFGFKTVGIRSRYYADNHEDALMMNLEEIDTEQLMRFSAGENQ